MKKIIIILILVLAALGSALAVLGSGGEYAAEVLFYRAMKANAKIMANPDVAPPALLSEVENGLGSVISKYPKSNMARTAMMALAEFYVAHKKFDEALSTIDRISATYKGDMAVSSAAQFMKGAVYERNGQWAKALAAFNKLRDDYPYTQLGMQVPLYIARYYDTKGDQAGSKRAYEEAQGFYEKIRDENRGKGVGFIASNMLTHAFINSKNFERAGESLQYTIDNYPSDMTYAQLAPAVNAIYTDKLASPKKTLEIFKKIRPNAKNKKLADYLDKKIAELEKVK